MTSDKLLKKERDLDITISSQMKKITSEIDKSMGNLIEVGIQKQMKLDKELKSIKEVCATFFDQYDHKIDKVQISNRKMEL